MEYVYISTEHELEEALRTLPHAPERCLDTETTGLNPYTGKIRLLQIGTPQHKTLLIDLFRIQHTGILDAHFAKETAEGVVYIGHHLKFDIKYMRHQGMDVPEHVHDIMICDQVLNAGKNGIAYSLAALGARYLHTTVDKSCQIGGWASPTLSEEQLQYASRDVDLPYHIYRIHKDLVRKSSLEYIVNLECSCIHVLAEMELAGVRVDVPQLERLKHELLLTQQTLETYLYTEVFHVTRDVNIYSPQQLKPLLQRCGVQVESTNKDTLRPLIEEFPFLEAVLKCRSIRDMMSKTFTPLPGFVEPSTGRIHTQFYQVGNGSNGTDTGRLSSADPNMQNIPAFTRMRACVVPAEGHSFVDVDYSQIEIRVMAEMTQDATLLDIFKNGLDTYRSTASRKSVLNKPVEDVTSGERTKVKAIVLGLIFGMQVPSLRKYLASQFNIHIEYAETQQLFHGILESWDGVKRYHDRIRHEQPLVTRTLKGRIRYFPTFHLNGAINAPIQGTAADIIKLAMVKLRKRLKEYPHTRLVLSVHDELMTECPTEYQEEMLHIQSQVMIEAGEEMLTTVPVVAEGKTGQNWGDVK